VCWLDFDWRKKKAFETRGTGDLFMHQSYCQTGGIEVGQRWLANQPQSQCAQFASASRSIELFVYNDNDCNNDNCQFLLHANIPVIDTYSFSVERGGLLTAPATTRDRAGGAGGVCQSHR
jgi:hypothetical protein